MAGPIYSSVSSFDKYICFSTHDLINPPMMQGTSFDTIMFPVKGIRRLSLVHAVEQGLEPKALLENVVEAALA